MENELIELINSIKSCARKYEIIIKQKAQNSPLFKQILEVGSSNRVL